MGTAFIASNELTEVPDGHKQAVVASDGRDTVYSTVYDVMNQRAFGDIPFVGDMALRAKRNDFLSEWHGREAELVQRVEAFIPGYVSAWQVADTDLIPLMYGEGAHAVKAIRPASQIMRDICLEAEQILRDRVSGLLER
jgi:nitronate monooxygenase